MVTLGQCLSFIVIKGAQVQPVPPAGLVVCDQPTYPGKVAANFVTSLRGCTLSSCPPIRPTRVKSILFQFSTLVGRQCGNNTRAGSENHATIWHFRLLEHVCLQRGNLWNVWWRIGISWVFRYRGEKMALILAIVGVLCFRVCAFRGTDSGAFIVDIVLVIGIALLLHSCGVK